MVPPALDNVCAEARGTEGEDRLGRGLGNDLDVERVVLDSELT
jgi:hypothetical protein